MKLIKTTALALIVSNIQAIHLNVQNESVAILQETTTTLTRFKDGNGYTKTRKQAANETVQDNGTLTQEGNSTFSHTLAEANSTIDNTSTMIQLEDDAADALNAPASDHEATFVQIESE